MSSDTQAQCMYMLEKLNEPLFLSPRGSNKSVYFIFEGEEKLSLSQDENVKVFVLKSPEKIPDLLEIQRTVREEDVFSLFLPCHSQAALDLIQIFTEQKSMAEFVAMCAFCRDRCNRHLWTYAMTSAIGRRKDTRGIAVPAMWEIMPDMFFPSTVLKAVSKQKNPGEASDIITVDGNLTGSRWNPEHKLWYFREDLAVASHHWHWHQIFTFDAPVVGPGSRDRKGELFYYMHHNMIARYQSERICLTLPLAEPLDLGSDQVLDVGYFSKLTLQNSSKNYGARQDLTPIRDIHRLEGNAMVSVSREDIRIWKERLLQAIDQGFVMGPEGSRLPLSPPAGIEVLGGLVENGGKSSVNPNYYGNLHNSGHNIISRLHDPQNLHGEIPGPMTDPLTATRDPAFYKWHVFIDSIFDKYKQTLPPYTDEELKWLGVRISGMETVRVNSENTNTLVTFWRSKDIDLSRGLDAGRPSTGGPMGARVTHLDHEAFTYRITIHNDLLRPARGTVRIFMGPSMNDQGQELPLYFQRLLFFEMDKFQVDLNPGVNQIQRKSTEASTTIPWNPSFYDIESQGILEDGSPSKNYCSCGWPQHMLLPKGTTEGFPFDLFVMVTDWLLDYVPPIGGTLGSPSFGGPQKCQGGGQSVSFCGVLDDRYPDSKAMGFPFDRKGSVGNKIRMGQSLRDFVQGRPNMFFVRVKILHLDQVMEPKPP